MVKMRPTLPTSSSRMGAQRSSSFSSQYRRMERFIMVFLPIRMTLSGRSAFGGREGRGKGERWRAVEAGAGAGVLHAAPVAASHSTAAVLVAATCTCTTWQLRQHHRAWRQHWALPLAVFAPPKPTSSQGCRFRFSGLQLRVAAECHDTNTVAPPLATWPLLATWPVPVLATSCTGGRGRAARSAACERALQRRGGRRVPRPRTPQEPHRADVRELLGAHIVGTHDEGLVVGVQVLAEAGVVLRERRGAAA